MIGVFVQVNLDSHHAKAWPIGYVIDGNGCWEWIGGKHPRGYGSWYIGGKTYRAHTVLYEREYGPIPAGMELDHLCRNTSCVNPAHLEAVPHRVNVLRGSGWTAKNALKTHCIHGHPLTPDNLIKCYRTRRVCAICFRAQQADYRKRHKGPPKKIGRPLGSKNKPKGNL